VSLRFCVSMLVLWPFASALPEKDCLHWCIRDRGKRIQSDWRTPLEANLSQPPDSECKNQKKAYRCTDSLLRQWPGCSVHNMSSGCFFTGGTLCHEQDEQLSDEVVMYAVKVQECTKVGPPQPVSVCSPLSRIVEAPASSVLACMRIYSWPLPNPGRVRV
jgi:hypothetical protein